MELLDFERKKLVDEIIEWHTNTFPETTKEEQEQKLIEEYQEWIEAKATPYLKKYAHEEKADVLIALIAMAYRYNCFAAKLALQGRLGEKTIDTIRKKMERNKNRKWKNNHHV